MCGAVFGALAVLGLRFSRGKDEEKEDLRMWTYVREFLKAFYKSEKLLTCRDLTGATARLLGEFMESEKFLKQTRK